MAKRTKPAQPQTVKELRAQLAEANARIAKQWRRDAPKGALADRMIAGLEAAAKRNAELAR